VFVETIRAVVIEDEFFDVANVAHVPHVIVVCTNGVSQRGKGVNNDTEDNVKTCDVDNNLETGIMNKLDQVLFLVIFVMDNSRDISDTTTHSHSFVKHGDVALEHVRAIVLSDDIRIIGVDTEVIHSVLNVKEGEGAIDVNDNHHQDCGQAYLSDVGRDSKHYILQNDRTVNYVKEMEAVINVAAGLAEERDSKVKNVVLES
jgi:hypothetical protein